MVISTECIIERNFRITNDKAIEEPIIRKRISVLVKSVATRLSDE